MWTWKVLEPLSLNAHYGAFQICNLIFNTLHALCTIIHAFTSTSKLSHYKANEQIYLVIRTHSIPHELPVADTVYYCPCPSPTGHGGYFRLKELEQEFKHSYRGKPCIKPHSCIRLQQTLVHWLRRWSLSMLCGFLRNCGHWCFFWLFDGDNLLLQITDTLQEIPDLKFFLQTPWIPDLKFFLQTPWTAARFKRSLILSSFFKHPGQQHCSLQSH